MSAKSSTSVAPLTGDPANQRAYFRWDFKGATFPCRMGKKSFEIRLKDLSRGGACGLVDEPFAVGDYFFIELDAHTVAEAQVVWTRRVMIGVRFGCVLTATFVTRLHERASEEAAQRRKEALSASRQH
jgi:hypothetical protein